MNNLLATGKLYLFVGILLGVSLLVITAIMLDLWDGVYTARALRAKVHSHKLRVTIAKMTEYFRFVLIGFLVDCLGLLFDFYSLPFVVILFGLGLISIEVKSLFEHAAERKSSTTYLPVMFRLFKRYLHKDKMSNLISEILDDDKSGYYENTNR
ncbi:MAG: phage holin family protein [Muribaculaceae bacterium]|nr:phage holin family protein [Muribaculaceae bacterium]